MFLRAEHVAYHIDGKPILRDCSLEVKAGEFIGIVGPNGSGKTTFLKALRGLVPADGGNVELFGKNIKSLREKEMARQVAYMQQSVQLGFGYVAEDIVMAARYPYLSWWENEGKDDKAIVERVMKETNTWHMKDRPVSLLSGGERQRVFLAKALAQETELLLLDEPTAALDLVHAHDMFRYCRRLVDEQQKAIVVVVHDLEMAAQYCTELVLLSRGETVATGPPKEVLTAPNLQKVFSLSSCVYEDPYFGNLRIAVLGDEEDGLNQRQWPPNSTVATGKVKE